MKASNNTNLPSPVDGIGKPKDIRSQMHTNRKCLFCTYQYRYKTGVWRFHFEENLVQVCGAKIEEGKEQKFLWHDVEQDASRKHDCRQDNHQYQLHSVWKG